MTRLCKRTGYSVLLQLQGYTEVWGYYTARCSVSLSRISPIPGAPASYNVNRDQCQLWPMLYSRDRLELLTRSLALDAGLAVGLGAA